MRIGEMAKQLGLAPETLRYYERLGLLPRPERNGSRYREYTEADAERLRLLVGLRQLDLILPLPPSSRRCAQTVDAGRCPMGSGRRSRPSARSFGVGSTSFVT